MKRALKTLRAFLMLVRFGNLLFIAVTQTLFYFTVYGSLAGKSIFELGSDGAFILLVLASVFIAAGGYVINDYFDIQIDQVNRPRKVVVDRWIKRRNVIIWHGLLSLIGLVFTFWVSKVSGKWSLLFLNILSVFVLWVYSTTYKKALLLGNLLIAVLTAWVILSVYWFAGKGWDAQYVWMQGSETYDVKKFFKLSMSYAGFAFVMTLIREVVKDLEDMMGDAQFGARTMPIVWGVPVSKMFAGVWLSVAAGGLIIISLYAWQSGVHAISLYALFALIVPILLIIRKLKIAQQSSDYHSLSSWIKWVMLAGILSMLFFLKP